MSKRHSSPVAFQCVNDCLITGCPGHELFLTHNLSTDQFEVWTDAELGEVFDEGRFHAMIKAYESLKEQIAVRK